MSGAPIFIVGCPRSGTSLLRDLLRADPELSIPPESYFIPSFFRAWGDPGSAAEARALAARILSMRPVKRWQLQLNPGDFEPCRSFVAVLDRLYGEFAAREGASRWGDKTPSYVLELPLLSGLFPEARFVHIHRDPRDVALSWLEMRFGPGNVFGAATAWKRFVATGRRDGASLGDRYMEVRYETLLTEPEAVMRSVCEFTQVPFTSALLRRAEVGPVYAKDSQHLERILSRAEIDEANAFGWRRRMRLADQAVVEAVAGDTLSELGYEREGSPRRIPRLSRVALATDDAVRSAIKRARYRQFTLRNAALVGRAELLGRLR